MPTRPRQVARRAAEAVAGLAHPMADGSVVHVTCSVGLALHPRDGRTGKALLHAADAAMYTHKRSRVGWRPGRARDTRLAPRTPGGKPEQPGLTEATSLT